MTPRNWFVDRDGLDWPTVLLGALTAAVLVALLVAGATSTAAFGPYTPDWDGTSAFRAAVDEDPDVESDLLRESNRYDELPANETVAFVIAPDEPYAADAAPVRRFVERGGTLVVLENVAPYGNDLLAAIGADARTDGRFVLDERRYDRGPAMPIATGVATHPRTADVDQLTLNHATAIEPNGATVLVATSEYAYLSEEPEADLDDEDTLASYPVATVEAVGDGEVVVVGDPSIAINAMYDDPDNAAFLRAQYADADRAVIDVSHAGGVPPLRGALLTVRARPLIQLGLGLLGVALVSVAAGRSRPALRAVRTRIGSARTRSPPADAEPSGLCDAERVAYLRARHPEWDDDRIERVVKALNRTRPKSEEQ